jgi:hypothetical protein
VLSFGLGRTGHLDWPVCWADDHWLGALDRMASKSVFRGTLSPVMLELVPS